MLGQCGFDSLTWPVEQAPECGPTVEGGARQGHQTSLRVNITTISEDDFRTWLRHHIRKTGFGHF